MAENQRAFNQVKAILDKLDRSIDRARDQRLHGDRPPPPATSEQSAPAPAPGRPARPENAVPPPASVVSPQRPGTSKYGKARPLRQPPAGEQNGTSWRRP